MAFVRFSRVLRALFLLYFWYKVGWIVVVVAGGIFVLLWLVGCLSSCTVVSVGECHFTDRGEAMFGGGGICVGVSRRAQ